MLCPVCYKIGWGLALLGLYMLMVYAHIYVSDH